jgi:hypothetical protein
VPLIEECNQKTTPYALSILYYHPKRENLGGIGTVWGGNVFIYASLIEKLAKTNL